MLVCEDDGDIGPLVVSFLEDAGHRVELVTTVADAVAAVSRRAPDVAVCDLELPDGSGGEVCAAAVAAGSRVVLMTAVPPETHPGGLPCGAEVLRKPFTAADLLRLVAG